MVGLRVIIGFLVFFSRDFFRFVTFLLSEDVVLIIEVISSVGFGVRFFSF